MAYKVIHALWLKTEIDRVEDIILMPRYWGREWTLPSIQEELSNTQHLHYSTEEIIEIGLGLVSRGIIESI